MKKKLLFFLITVFAYLPTNADQTLSEVKYIFLESVAQEIIKQTLDKNIDVFQVGGIDIQAGNIVIAAYNLHKSVDDNNNSTTDSQKYYSAVRAINTVIGAIAPSVSAIISLSTMGHQVAGALSTKSINDRTQRLQILALENQRQSILNISRVVQSEIDEIKFLTEELQIIDFSVANNLDYITSNCLETSPHSLNKINNCINLISYTVSALSEYQSIFKKILSFNGIYISTNEITKILDQQNNPFFENLNESYRLYQNLLKSFDTLISEAFVLRKELLKIQFDETRLKLELILDCEYRLRNSISYITEAKRDLISLSNNKNYSTLGQRLTIQKLINNTNIIYNSACSNLDIDKELLKFYTLHIKEN